MVLAIVPLSWEGNIKKEFILDVRGRRRESLERKYERSLRLAGVSVVVIYLDLYMCACIVTVVYYYVPYNVSTSLFSSTQRSAVRRHCLQRISYPCKKENTHAQYSRKHV